MQEKQRRVDFCNSVSGGPNRMETKNDWMNCDVEFYIWVWLFHIKKKEGYVPENVR